MLIVEGLKAILLWLLYLTSVPTVSPPAPWPWWSATELQRLHPHRLFCRLLAPGPQVTSVTHSLESYIPLGSSSSLMDVSKPVAPTDIMVAELGTGKDPAQQSQRQKVA